MWGFQRFFRQIRLYSESSWFGISSHALDLICMNGQIWGIWWTCCSLQACSLCSLDPNVEKPFTFFNEAVLSSECFFSVFNFMDIIFQRNVSGTFLHDKSEWVTIVLLHLETSFYFHMRIWIWPQNGFPVLFILWLKLSKF